MSHDEGTHFITVRRISPLAFFLAPIPALKSMVTSNERKEKVYNNKEKLKKSRRKYFQSRTIFRWMERVFGCSRQSHGWLASFFYNFPATIVGALRNNGWFESIGTDSWERERWNRLFGDKFYWESRGIPSVHTHNYVNEKHVGCLRKEAIKYRRERDKVAGKHRHLVFGVFMEFILLIADVVTGATFMDHHDDRPATTVPWPALPDRKEPCVCVCVCVASLDCTDCHNYCYYSSLVVHIVV